MVSGSKGAPSSSATTAVAAKLINAISTVTPAAMLGSTAPYPDPGEVMVEVSSRQPVTMMAAFERPVPPTLDAAVAALNTPTLGVFGQWSASHASRSHSPRSSTKRPTIRP
jgi:hypothetical protein